MDFDLSEEQRLLKDSVERFVADRYGFEARKAAIAEPEGFSRQNWAQFAELGLLAVPFAEEHGGIGGGAVETMIVMEAFGGGLVIEPVPLERGDQRRASPSCRERGAEGRTHPRHCRRQPACRFRPNGA
jgi:alkylation response protein AidB-like acyl-CoA dehydrogenase